MYRNLAILIFLSFYMSGVYANDIEQDYYLKTAQTITFIDQHQTDIWPTFQISATPSLVHFDDSNFVHIYAFNLTPKNPDWQTLSAGSVPVYYMGQDEYQIKGVTNYDLDLAAFGVPPTVIDGQPSYIFQAMDVPTEYKQDIVHDIHTFVHERFHGYQFRKFLPAASWFYNAYDGANSLINIQLAYLEVEPLKNYLLTGDKESLKDFIAINQFRTRLLDKTAAIFEEQKENTEGTADYVGWKSMNLPDAIYKNNIVKDYNYGDQCTLAKTDTIIGCVESWRYYILGDAMGIALDQLSITNWKEALEKSGTSVRSQLFKLFPMDEKEIIARVERAKLQYHFAETAAAIEKIMKPYIDEIHQQQKNYQKLPGIEFNMDAASCQQTTSEHHDNSYEINTQEQLLSNASLVSACSDQSVMVKYEHVPLLYSLIVHKLLPTPSATTTSIFKISPDTILVIDNQQVTVKKFVDSHMRILFHKLNISTPQIDIKIEGVGGVLDGTHGSLKLQYQQTRKAIDLKNNQI